MSGVEFDSDKLGMMQKMQSFNPGRPTSSSKFIQWLMDKGIVSTEAAGQMVLVGVVIFNIVISILIFVYIV
jgi:hypothetical protein